MASAANRTAVDGTPRRSVRVVHQVVVHERHRVQQLEGRRGPHDPVIVGAAGRADTPSSRRRAQPFATGAGSSRRISSSTGSRCGSIALDPWRRASQERAQGLVDPRRRRARRRRSRRPARDGHGPVSRRPTAASASRTMRPPAGPALMTAIPEARSRHRRHDDRALHASADSSVGRARALGCSTWPSCEPGQPLPVRHRALPHRVLAPRPGLPRDRAHRSRTGPGRCGGRRTASTSVKWPAVARVPAGAGAGGARRRSSSRPS